VLLTTLMTTNRSEYPWNIMVKKDKNFIILDKFEPEKKAHYYEL